MEQENITQLMSITGLPLDQAQMYMEMSGNNLEIAISMFFEQGGAMGEENLGGDNQQQNQQQQQQSQGEISVPEDILWPSKNNLPEAWQIQGIEFDEQNPLGLKQHQNGPCGPLSVINAVLISQLLKKENFQINQKVSNEDLIAALLSILRVCSEEGTKQYILCTKNQQNDQVNNTCNTLEEAQQFLSNNLSIYQQPGGLILFLYSVILTKGVKKIQQEVVQSGGELPLVVPPFYICVTDLIMLMLTGIANGNVGQFDPMNLQKIPINNKLQIGLLSSSVHQINIPINDALLTPENNVFILHGGEHFTTMFTTQKSLDEEQIEFYQWNGLKPGGPRMCRFLLKNVGGKVNKQNIEPSQYQKQHTQYKPEIGEIDSIIQAKNEDKTLYPKQYEKWNYEVAIVTHSDKDVKYPNRPEDIPKPQLFPQGEMTNEPWRCMACYNKRFQTMCFGQNEAGAEKCQHCQMKREHCGWSIFLHYDQLPKSYQRSLTRQHGPKIFGILEIKWTKIQLEFLDNQEPPTI